MLHAFDGRHPFGDETRQRIADLKRVYKLDLDADASHRLLEAADRETEAVSTPVLGKLLVRSQRRSTKSHEMTRNRPS
jgi:hypothetical protein